jgi:hypothetical protein
MFGAGKDNEAYMISTLNVVTVPLKVDHREDVLLSHP